MIAFEARSPKKELMDEVELNPVETARTYRLLRYVNQFLGGNQVILTHLSHFLRNKPACGPVQILDVASGGADIPQAIVLWARRRKLNVSITALDASPNAIQFAKEQSRDYPEIDFIRGSSFDLPFDNNSFDYVISSMFFHHLKDEDIVTVLKNFDRIARRGIIINDLLRSRPAYYGISLLSQFTSDRFFRNDAPLSVLRGFSFAEFEIFGKKSGLNYLKTYRHYAFRLALAGERSTNRGQVENPKTYLSPVATTSHSKNQNATNI